MHRWLTAAAAALLVSQAARGEEFPFLVVASGNYTTSTSLFPNPAAAGEFDRAYSIELEGSTGYGLEFRWAIPSSSVTIGLGAEYITASTSGLRPLTPSSLRTVPVTDGYTVVPVELTAYLAIPVSGESFGLFMGAGGGAYIGRRSYELAGVEAPSTGNGTGFGIHVLAGARWRFGNRIMLIGTMKFRDLQFESSNAFPVSSVTYNGTVIPVSTEPFPSRVNTDGIVFQLGAGVAF